MWHINKRDYDKLHELSLVLHKTMDETMKAVLFNTELSLKLEIHNRTLKEILDEQERQGIQSDAKYNEMLNNVIGVKNKIPVN